ncbi:hypothetical protein ABZ419_28120 [Streptomyces cinnamoneus]|uniref:hypothetical protein n=1 Tax=Streptomyces cinnamoneus TaxID=53446 RepID=UPI0033CE41F3
MRTRSITTSLAVTAATALLGLGAAAMPASASAPVADPVESFTNRATEQRTCPRTTCHSVRKVEKGWGFDIECYKRGQSVLGSTIWYRGVVYQYEWPTHGFIPAKHLKLRGNPGVPVCRGF